MKLYRFTAANNHRAMTTVTSTLGPNALVYATRKIPGGVEILAGLPFGVENMVDYNHLDKNIESEVVEANAIKIQEGIKDNKILENLKLQIEEMHESIGTLSERIATLQQTFTERLKNKRFFKRDFFKKIALFFLKINFHRSRSTN